MSRDTVLGWTPGIYAQKHDVYFGTVCQNVNNASRNNPLDVLVSQNQDAWLTPPSLWRGRPCDMVAGLIPAQGAGHEMWVWNSNDSLEPMIGFGFKDVTIEYSLSGTDYTTLGTTDEFAQAPGTPAYAHNTTVDLSGVIAKYVRLTANSNWGGILNQYGLSEVRFFYIPLYARKPNPDSVNPAITMAG